MVSAFEGCSAREQKQTGSQSMRGTFEQERSRGSVHFAKQRTIQSEQQIKLFSESWFEL